MKIVMNKAKHMFVYKKIYDRKNPFYLKIYEII